MLVAPKRRKSTEIAALLAKSQICRCGDRPVTQIRAQMRLATAKYDGQVVRRHVDDTIEREPATICLFGHIVEIAHAPTGISLPEASVELQVAGRRMSASTLERTVETKRSGTVERACGPVEHPEARLPRSDVDHVGARDRIAALDRPLVRGDIEGQRFAHVGETLGPRGD